MEELKQGTRVEFDYQTIKGKGTIVGVAMSQPILGVGYIIEPDDLTSTIVSSTGSYNYTHFVVWSCYLKVV
jgi:hypothetical protein